MEPYERNGCLHEIFTKQAKETPNSVAIVTHDGQEITYKELDEVTDILSMQLRHLGVVRNSVVGILMDRCLEYVYCYIAILKAGGSYLPLEASYPLSLLKSVLQDAEPIAICTKSNFLDRISNSFDNRKIITMGENWAHILTEGMSKLPPILEPAHVTLDDMAYTVYSSGTTGKPKGIQCPHRGAVFSYYWRHMAYPYADDDHEACNVFFVWEMLRPLLKGITMYVIPDDVIYDPPQLTAFIKKHKITRMMFTPSLLESILDFKGLDLDKSFATMRQIWFCGEVVTTILRNRVAKQFPDIQLLNLYSVSECHDIACADLTKMSDQETRRFCPVGKLLPGVHIVVMDEDGVLQPVGAPGEIYVGGPALAIGYLNRPDMNAQRFIERPPNVPSHVGSRLYRTGDWGYVLSDGNLEICGRCDSMVKIRGYSIELQAVESSLLELPMVKNGCVLAQGEEGTDKFLVAYIIAKGETSRKEVRAALKKKLPFYMIPSKFIFLNSLPMLESSGKLDKKALPKIDPGSESGIDPQDLPSTPREHQIAAIWCQVLNLPAIDVQENFFDLGGHSLLAARILSEMNEKLGLDLVISDLFSHPSVSTMAVFLDDPSGTNGDSIKLDLSSEVERHDQGKALMDIRLRAFWRSFQLHNPRWRRDKILLTGVTGFLGAFLLKELLISTKTTVYCLVRETPGLTPHTRIKDTLKKYGIIGSGGDEAEDISKRLEWRVVPIKGDIALVNLGMSEDDYNYLSYEIDSIIHGAAMVNLIYPYRALHSANVLGTENIINFALNHKIKPVHHISTDAVFPDGFVECSENSDMSQYKDKLTTGYSQSKWVAEQLVFRAKSRGLPVAIYRCGNIAGSIEHPSWNTSDFFLLMLQTCIILKHAPDINWQIEMTPVDLVSKFIVTLAQDIMHSIGKVFHIVNNKSMDCQHLWQVLQVQGYSIEVVPYQQWYKMVREKALAEGSTKSVVKSLLHILDGLVRNQKYFSKLSTFSRDNTDASLMRMDLEYSPVDATLMRTYLRLLARAGLIYAPKRGRRDTAQILHGRVALVTGASSGIGVAIAEHLACAGARVALAARRLDKLKDIHSQIKKQGGVTICVAMDVTNREQVTEGIAYIESMLGPINILVNNAGVMYYTMMKNVRVEEWQQMIDINCTGVVNCLAATLDKMVERRDGHIVNISSDAGKRPFPGLAVYSGTKFFIEGMSSALRQEVSPFGVKVTCIQPGDVKTDLIKNTTDQEAKDLYAVGDQVKILEPSDVAQAVMFAVTQRQYCAINEMLIEPRECPI